MIEAREVIHVRVRDEHVAHAQEFARRQRGDVSGIEENRAAPEFQVDGDAGIAERSIG